MKFDGFTFVFDVDGTLCPIKGPDERYEDMVPFPEMADRIRELKAEGARIIIHTSRNMRTYQNNIGLINANTAKVLLAWLDKWEIPYDEIVYGKPWAGPKGFYVDDKTLRPEEFLRMNPEEMDRVCKGDRLQHDN
ncbi:MAG: capsular biosynthesis protein [Lachnospiraceae bacterium]|nr:capsular biosynthesis protein [Lachnospiraceae bacterium]